MEELNIGDDVKFHFKQNRINPMIHNKLIQIMNNDKLQNQSIPNNQRRRKGFIINPNEIQKDIQSIL